MKSNAGTHTHTKIKVVTKSIPHRKNTVELGKNHATDIVAIIYTTYIGPNISIPPSTFINVFVE